MSASTKPKQKQFWSPSEVAELTAAAVAALPASISQAAATMAAKKESLHDCRWTCHKWNECI